MLFKELAREDTDLDEERLDRLIREGYDACREEDKGPSHKQSINMVEK